MNKWKVTCIQHDVIFGNPEANYAKMEKLLERAMKDTPDVIVLPELWTIGYDLTRLDEIAEEGAGRTKAFLSEAARRYGVYLVGGSTAKRTRDGVYNTLLVYDREGQPISEYDKAHLFKLMDEHLYLRSGSGKGLFELGSIRSAGVVCYDIRFPEWIRTHISSGAETLFVVAQWPLARLEHWRALLIARAIENQCWVVACNRSGSDPSNVFAGHSMVVGPWGEVIAEAGESDEFLTADIDMAEVIKARGRIPVFEDRRPELYE